MKENLNNYLSFYYTFAFDQGKSRAKDKRYLDICVLYLGL